jgi:hypothetical protein
MQNTLSLAAEKNATRMNLRHYREVWGGNLPASVYMLKRYILAMAGLVDVKLIRSRVNAVSKWHRDNAQPDPGADVVVRAILRGVVKVHRHDYAPVDDAKTLTFEHLEEICHEIEVHPEPHQNYTSRCLSMHRNQALLLLGFWAGLSGAQLSKLTTAHLHFPGTGGLDIAVPTKSVLPSQKNYSLHHIRELKRLCPVQAIKDWLHIAKISQGPIFRSVSRWGHVGGNQLSHASISSIIKKISCAHAAINLNISSKSLPRGFAVWAKAHGWDDDDILDYLGVTSQRSVFSTLSRRKKDFGSLSMFPKEQDDN